MKKFNKKGGNEYTKLGLAIHLSLIAVGFTAFVVLLGCAGESDLGGELNAMKAFICLIVFGVCVLLHNKIFE